MALVVCEEPRISRAENCQVLLYFGVGNLMNILYNILMERPLWLSSSGCWIVVIAVLLMLLAQAGRSR